LKVSLHKTPIGYVGSETGMRPSTVVMYRPRFEDLSDVRLVERNHEIQTLPANRADQTFTKRVRIHGQLHRMVSVRRSVFR